MQTFPLGNMQGAIACAALLQKRQIFLMGFPIPQGLAEFFLQSTKAQPLTLTIVARKACSALAPQPSS